MCVMMLLCFVCVVAVSLTVAAGEFFLGGGRSWAARLK